MDGGFGAEEFFLWVEVESGDEDLGSDNFETDFDDSSDFDSEDLDSERFGFEDLSSEDFLFVLPFLESELDILFGNCGPKFDGSGRPTAVSEVFRFLELLLETLLKSIRIASSVSSRSQSK